MDKKEQLVALWKTCFGDSDSFIRLYFDRVYRFKYYGLFHLFTAPDVFSILLKVVIILS